MRVIWSDRALTRVEDIALHIAQDSRQAAVRWVEDIFAAVDGLTDFPELGKPGRDVAVPGVREFVLGNYRVFYEVGSDVEILTVRSARELIDEDELRGD